MLCGHSDRIQSHVTAAHVLEDVLNISIRRYLTHLMVEDIFRADVS
jgi:hypothetical protein